MRTVSTRDQTPAGVDEQQSAVDFTAYLDLLARYRKTFLSVVGVVIVVGLVYAFLAKPVYRTNLTVQVEESGGNHVSKLIASISPGPDVKPAASAEIELLRSRMVVGKAVDNLRLYIEAAPRYFPLIGPAIASFNPELSHPGLFGWGGFAWGHESITVSQLDVPASMEERKIRLTALGNNEYRVRFASDDAEATGKVGSPLTITTANGAVTMLVSQLDGRPGTQFVLRRLARTAGIARLQEKLTISERGKDSGVIGVSLEGVSPDMTAAILNEIGNAYVDQNIRRKAAEAEKSLAFLEQQLPLLRQQVDTAETRYNAMRNQRGTIDLGEESKLILGQSVQIQTKLQELQQKRQELAARFTSTHPAIALVDSQISGLTAQLNGVSGRIQKLPDVEQNVVRLMRDVKVSTELLQSLLNEVQQLKLIKASKVGTARIVDPAEVPLRPVRPDRALIAGLSLALGLVAGLLVVFVRHTLEGGVADPDEIERQTGMTVYSTIPFSKQQSQLSPGAGLLALQQPDDPTVESLRSFRTALRFAMAGSNSPTVVITGPAPGVGKSFVCANFAAIAATGSRVVLIDADLRRGSLQSSFDVKRGPGLTELLMGAPLEQVLQRQVAPGLDFIPTGSQPPHAIDLLLSPAMDSLLEQLKARYDLVLIDTPPVLVAADAGILAGKAGAVFLVARAEKTTTGELVAAQRAIRQAGADVKGVLFNGLLIEGRWYRAHSYFGKYRYLADYGNGQTKRA
ncbi:MULTISPECIES: polysaccharide biosynthesis tyrosine autokinase [unclassified Cupriavidus]|uniref:polysaccharide biosynthesis tyrosine autokinase n=1 Tax=unclassified Cupriavidus TaxID=2640874 RepID=UPI001AEB0D05|nr:MULTISPECIES: polysaccharide biosynthesis tyrosine autokinase [unclassified Cupriavidus]MBP0629223.1 polysaccharide biosynthesis tyrosine autokinase [Cupriavidus sp. AcVe19-1a]MBP0635716.1 polysaccharide biosynthesis tyrosine autokinase [Cupriavidus sp. AcVe19-6a]